MSVLKFKNPNTGEYEVLVRGKKGDKGDAGTGVAAGGSTGQILSKNSTADHDTEWIDKPTSGVWGQITGTLSNQTDLNSALAGKASSSHTHSTTDLTATGGTTTSFLRKDNTWATPTNTTYTEITSAEITDGTASTSRAISGRRAQEIVNKARTGVVKSTTTVNLTASATAPASPSTGDVWIDTNDLPEELAPTSIVWKETPAGTVNGTNTNFTTSSPYISGSLQVFVNGLAQNVFTTETAPGSGNFSLDTAPQTGDDIKVQYQIRTMATGNADTVDGFHANAAPTPNNIPVLDASGKLAVTHPADDYFLSEVDTCTKWIDGKSIYKKTISFSVTVSGSEQGFSDPVLATIDRVIKMEGVKQNSAGSEIYPMQYVNPVETTSQNFQFKIGTTGGTKQFRYNSGTDGTAIITIYYTKI